MKLGEGIIQDEEEDGGVKRGVVWDGTGEWDRGVA